MATLGWQDIWPAPAKLNLFLHVVGRRPDGYHLLQTVFRFLDRGDRLRFSPRDDGQIVLATPLPGVPPDTDLTVRAARALQAATGTRLGATIDLEKCLPMGGGLGGGSSDAATTLIALNHLWHCGLTSEALQAIGLTLGADVPVFIHGHSTFAEGVGERFTDVAPPPAWYLVAEPPVHVPTADIFRDPSLRRDTPPIAPADWHPDLGGNDLEAVACARYPQIREHLDQLRRLPGAGRVAMSGSGACCFATFDGEAPARRALAALSGVVKAWVAAGRDRHPLCDLTAREKT